MYLKDYKSNGVFLSWCCKSNHRGQFHIYFSHFQIEGKTDFCFSEIMPTFTHTHGNNRNP